MGEQEYNVREDEQVCIWRSEVFKRDRFTCVICLNKGKRMNAHHIDGYNWCVEKRYIVDNGVTLCECCHKAFHDKYGYGCNVREQWDEFRKDEGRQLEFGF